MKNKKWNYNLTIGTIIAVIVILTAVIGLFWTPYGPTDMDYMLKNAGPSLLHPFGCDNFGRDILSRIMNGMGTTCFVALSTVAIGVVFGILNFARIYFLTDDPDKVMMGLVLGCAMIFTILMAKTLGAVLPLLAKTIKLDPAVVASPMITTIVDVVSLMFYFKLAMVLLSNRL